MIAFDIVCAVLVLAGCVFCLIGGLGLIRLPDVYTRCHAAGMTDSAGVGGVLVGLAFASNYTQPLVTAKLLMVLIFVWLSSVVSTHALLKAAYARGVRVDDDDPEDWTTVARPPERDPEDEDEPDAEEDDDEDEDA